MRLAEEHNAIAEGRQQLRMQRAELHRRSFMSAASSGIGQTLEMVAASLPGLPTAGHDCRALLKPLDYLAFVGAAAGKVEAIRFIEVKTGRQRLSMLQRAIKAAVEAGAVKLRVADHQVKVK
jgi:predicted Holliday junction resolvase-like endonuclease